MPALYSGLLILFVHIRSMKNNITGVFFLLFIFALLTDLQAQVHNMQTSAISFSDASLNGNDEADPEEEREKKGKKPDRPDLAREQEVRLTKDPALGYVPMERLQNAFNIVKQQRYQRGPQPLAATAAAATWTERGPSNVGGRTRALMYDPNDLTNKKVWAGGVGGGLWYTNDISVASPLWINVNDFWANIAISCITYNPANKLEMYVGTGEGWYNADAIRGLGIWKTSDGGITWTQLSGTNNSTFYHVQKIVVSSAGIVYASTRSGGVRRSADGGNSWSQVLAGAAADLEIGADGTLYASIGIFSTDGIYSSANGTTWTKRNTGANGFPTSGFNRIEIACAPSDANVLYALTQEDVNNGIGNIYKSSDKGVNWTTVNKPTDADLDITTDFTRGQAWYDLIAAVDPANSAKLIVGGVDLFYTTNSGSTWTQISKWSNNANMNTLSCSTVHADQHAITFQPGSSTVFLSGNDGGVYRCANVTTAGSSSQFSNKNSGYNVTQYYACAINGTAGSNNFIAGAQDNGTQKYTVSGMNSTSSVSGGDGAYCFIDQTNGNYQISSYVYNYYYRTTNNWSTKTTISSSTTTGSFINPADYDDANGILYSAYSTSQVQRISGIRSTPSAAVQFTVTGMTEMATHLRVSPYASIGTTTLFVGTGNGKLYKVTNAHGASPVSTSIGSASFPGGSVSCVEIGATENDLLVTFYNYGVTSVWRTTNGGSTWSSKEGDLPDMPVRWAFYNPSNLSEVLLATEVGVWSTSDITASSPAWVANNNGLSNVRVDMLQYRSSDKTLIAATHGRGLFSTNYFSTTVPSADFSASATTICSGTSITFTDLSTNSPTSWTWSFPGGTPSSSTAQNPVVTYNSAGTYSVSLTAGNANGSNLHTKTNYIAVTASVTASINITATPSGTTCMGSNIFFSATPTNGGTTPVYQWKVNGTNVGTNSSTYSSTVLTNGSQVTCVLTSNAACVSGSPATSNVLTMSRTSTVPVSISITANPSNSICSGTSVTFTAVPTNGGAGPAYQWKLNGTNVGTNSNTYTNSSLANGNIVTCVLTSNATCPSGNPATSNGITMTVNPNVTASVSISANPAGSVCAGTNITFSAAPVNGGSSPAYQWSLNGTNVGSNSATYSSTSLSTGDQLMCTMTSNAPCMSGSPASSNTIQMTVNPSVTAGVNISANPSTTICSGTNVTFTATPINGGTTPVYQWQLNGTNVGTNSSTYSSSTLANGNQVSCILTSNATCVTGNPASSNNLTMTVNANITATIGISVSPATTVCTGTTVTFTANPVNGGSSPIYQWKMNGTNVGTNSPSYSTNSFVSNSLFRCEMNSSAPCVTNATATSNTIRITLTPLVTAGISISSAPASICAGTNMTFNATPVNGGASPSYQWQLNGTNVGTNSSSYANNSLTDGNQVSCLLTSNANCVTGNPATSNILTALNCQATLALKVFIEGYYLGGGMMRAVADSVNYPTICDTLDVSLAQSAPPYSIFQSVKGTVNTSGNGSFTFSAVPPSNYYLVLEHRNALETWSSTAIASSPAMSYDFSTSASQAYGSNQKSTGDGNFAIISGDINQENVIDMNDILLLEQSIQNLTSGYVNEDLNGDWVVEGADFSLLENNIGLFVTQRP